LTEQMVLFEELGRALAPGPWLGSVLAASALAAAGHASATAVSAGETRVALCLDPLGGALALRGDRLSGSRRAVLGAGLADAFLVVDDAGVLFVPLESGVTVDASASLTRPILSVRSPSRMPPSRACPPIRRICAAPRSCSPAPKPSAASPARWSYRSSTPRCAGSSTSRSARFRR
jgi:hypothetical protein